jgi:hypothetical protein
MFFSSSPTLSHSFFSLILLQVVDLKLEENVFFFGLSFLFWFSWFWWGEGIEGKKMIVVILMMTHNMKLVKGLKRKREM